MVHGFVPLVMAAGCVFPNTHFSMLAMRPVFVFRSFFMLPAVNLALVTLFTFPAFFAVAEKIIESTPVGIECGNRGANPVIQGSTIPANLFAPTTTRIFQEQLFHF